MERSYIFMDVPKNTESDRLSEYIGEFSFVSNAFGHQSNDPRAVCSNRITGDFELIFIKGGKSLITISDTEYACSPGDAVLIPPFTLHKIQTPADNPHDNYWIHFDLQPFYRQAEFITALLPEGSHKITVQCMDEALKLYADMEREIQENKPGSMAIYGSLLIQLIVVLLRQTAGGTSPLKNPSRNSEKEMDIIHESMAFIQKNLGEAIGVETLCGCLHVSQSCLFKTFSNVLHSSPNTFIQLCKIKKAEQLMKSTSLSFKEISQALAFSSPYYFSSVFKKFYRMSPRDYIHSLQR